MAKWSRELPDVSDWQPGSAQEQALRDSLMVTCQLAQARIAARAAAERRFNLHNFDSGAGVEDIVREELGNLLPERYSVHAGVVSDRRGSTAGDCDLVVRDAAWSPLIKPGATGGSRRYHFPIEGLYAGVEIKQTLGPGELDAAMRKLVVLARLERPHNPYGHITENQHLESLDRPGAILNPLHTTVFATSLPEGATLAEVAERFGAINARLERDHMVKMLCVLDHGTAWYGPASGTVVNATYMLDREEPLVLQVNSGEPDHAFYRFYVELLGHLTRSVLNLVGVARDYGRPPPPRDVRTYDSAAFNGGS